MQKRPKKVSSFFCRACGRNRGGGRGRRRRKKGGENSGHAGAALRAGGGRQKKKMGKQGSEINRQPLHPKSRGRKEREKKKGGGRSRPARRSVLASLLIKQARYAAREGEKRGGEGRREGVDSGGLASRPYVN